MATLGARYAAHLPFAMLAQTLAFVMLNKVRTGGAWYVLQDSSVHTQWLAAGKTET